jgi:methylase of polypeptide subunit release factors
VGVNMEKFYFDNNTFLYYDAKLDGGGGIFGINMLKMDFMNKFYGSDLSVCEMCSGPGFIGFYLKNNNLCNDITLVDINENNRKYIEKTVSENKLENVEFIVSDGFDNVFKKFDLILMNPPHHGVINPDNDKIFVDEMKLINYDKKWKFHENFYHNVGNFLEKNGVAVIVENHLGSTKHDFLPMIDRKVFGVEIFENLKLGWTGKSEFYILILKRL